MLRRLIRQVAEDADAVVARDPATSSRLEALLTSPGLHAIAAHRVAHALWQRPGGRLPARVLGTVSRAVTGVEIHPGATIGRRLVIDHGMGVVVGETAVVGDDVMMYHGVTLGGTSGDAVKRHPTVGDGVLLGAADTFRAAAADQLQTWSARVGAEVVRGAEGADPASVGGPNGTTASTSTSRSSCGWPFAASSSEIIPPIELPTSTTFRASTTSR